jgi:hypothetical protein
LKFAAGANCRDLRLKSAIMPRKCHAPAPIKLQHKANCFFRALGGFILFHPAREASSYQSGSLRPRKSPRHAVEKSRPLSRVLSWTVIPLGCASPRSSSDLPGSLMWATCAADMRRVLPYLVLLPVGFAVPRVLPPARCALTAPFHPCRRRLRGA